MSYNLQSLITILEQLLNPSETRWIVTYNKARLQSLLKKAASLQQILENISVESLEGRIRCAAQKAEVLESHMVDQLLSRGKRARFSFPTPSLRQVMKDFDFVREQVVKIVEGKTKMLSLSTGSSSSCASIFFPDHASSKNVAVGFDDDLLKLKEQLTGHEKKLEIIPVVGIFIGKTTLARNLYEDPFIVYHFDVCAWTTISQDYNVRAILLGLLRRPNEKLSNEITSLTDNEYLKEILHKRLFGRRYLVVLDDMWSTQSWDVIRKCFPDNNNGSRIVLTTRESDVAKYVGTKLQYEVQLLQELESWKLLQQIVFGKEGCHDIALKWIGRKIARSCGGLPLAINVIGGLLSKTERSRVVWEQIAHDVSAAIAKTDDEQFSNVLSLSYNHLSNHLKPCFLYMGAFPEDYEIKGSRLIYMWIGEGLVKSNGDKTLEEEAEDYLKALVERSLLQVTRKKSNGKPMQYGMHDLLRDLCRRKGGDEKFVHVKNERAEGALPNKVRRVSFQTSCPMDIDVDALSLARSFICTDLDMPHVIVSPVFLVLRLLRVLHMIEIQFEEFPQEILPLVNLHYLAFSCNSDVPKEISRLLNLQALIGEIDGGNMPSEIWEMSELRHLKLDTIINIKEGGT